MSRVEPAADLPSFSKTSSDQVLTRREVIAGLAAAGMVSGCMSEEDGDVPARRTSKSFGGMTIYNDSMLPPLAGTFPAYTDHSPRLRCIA